MILPNVLSSPSPVLPRQMLRSGPLLPVRALLGILVLCSTPGIAQAQAPEPAPVATAAEPLVWSGRVQGFAGRYDIDTTRTVTNGFDPPSPSRFEDHTGYYGLATGLTVARGRYGIDFGVDYADIDRNDVTEFSVRGVTTFGEYGTAALGYRLALQGTGFADDDIYRERGFLVGLGFRKLRVPVLSETLVGLLSGSLTYSRSELDLPTGNEPDADGLLAIVKAPLTRFPAYGVGVRYRRFEVEDVTTVTGSLRVRDELTEEYFAGFVEYVFSW